MTDLTSLNVGLIQQTPFTLNAMAKQALQEAMRSKGWVSTGSELRRWIKPCMANPCTQGGIGQGLLQWMPAGSLMAARPGAYMTVAQVDMDVRTEQPSMVLLNMKSGWWMMDQMLHPRESGVAQSLSQL